MAHRVEELPGSLKSGRCVESDAEAGPGAVDGRLAHYDLAGLQGFKELSEMACLLVYLVEELGGDDPHGTNHTAEVGGQGGIGQELAGARALEQLSGGQDIAGVPAVLKHNAKWDGASRADYDLDAASPHEETERARSSLFDRDHGLVCRNPFPNFEVCPLDGPELTKSVSPGRELELVRLTPG